MSHPFFQRRDWLWCLLILLLAALLYALPLFFSCTQAPLQAHIYLDNQLLETVSLSENRTFTPTGVSGVSLRIENGQIRFLSSDCPDQTCVRTGFLSSPGQYAVCLPHRLMVQLPHAGSPAVDIVAVLPEVTCP